MLMTYWPCCKVEVGVDKLQAGYDPCHTHLPQEVQLGRVTLSAMQQMKSIVTMPDQDFALQ